MTLSRGEILSAADLRTEVVSVPEWGGDVIVRELTGAERDDYESSLVVTNGRNITVNSKNLRARLVVLSCIDESGERLFTANDVEELGKKSASALDRIVDVAKRLSRIGEEQLNELGKSLNQTDSEDSAFSSLGN